MTDAEVSKLKPGLYRAWWGDGVMAVGVVVPKTESPHTERTAYWFMGPGFDRVMLWEWSDIQRVERIGESGCVRCGRCRSLEYTYVGSLQRRCGHSESACYQSAVLPDFGCVLGERKVPAAEAPKLSAPADPYIDWLKAEEARLWSEYRKSGGTGPFSGMAGGKPGKVKIEANKDSKGVFHVTIDGLHLCRMESAADVAELCGGLILKAKSLGLEVEG